MTQHFTGELYTDGYRLTYHPLLRNYVEVNLGTGKTVTKTQDIWTDYYTK